MKRGKSTKLYGYRSFKINYGTVDAKDLKSIYVNIQTWAEPKFDIDNPQKIVNSLSREIKHTTLEFLDRNLFHENFIVDLDLRSSGIQFKKRSFLNLECYFYLSQENMDFKSLKLKRAVRHLVDGIIRNNLTKNKTFSFSLTKAGLTKNIP